TYNRQIGIMPAQGKNRLNRRAMGTGQDLPGDIYAGCEGTGAAVSSCLDGAGFLLAGADGGDRTMRLGYLPESGNIEDRRGEEGGGGGGLSLGGGGGWGIGTMVVLGLTGWALGIAPRLLIGGAEMVSGSHTNSPPSNARRTTSTPTDESGRFVSRILGSTEAVWKDGFARGGQNYRPPVFRVFCAATDGGRGGPAQRSLGAVC